MYFITFRSARGPLPLEALRQVKVNILHDHGKKYDLWCVVVMPDHVHLMMQPRQKEPGVWFDLAEISKGIKGVSSRRINQILGTTGKVWQEESFDRIVRDQKGIEEKLNYMYFNP